MAAIDVRLKVNQYVKVDNRGVAKIISIAESTAGPMYTVVIDGTEYEVTLPAYRLSPYSEAEQTKRFVSIDADQIDKFVAEQSNKNTLSKTFYDLKILRNFLNTQNDEREIYDIPPVELCPLLCKFFLSVRKADGSNYEPTSLRGFMSSFERQLNRHEYGFSLVSSIEFSKVRSVLKAKQIELKREGKGNKPNKAEPLTVDEIDRLWNSYQLGKCSPEAVINTLWLYNTIHFGLRGSDEHRDMSWGDIKLCMDSNGQEYLEFTERQSKTRQGHNPRDVRVVRPKMWSNIDIPERCPVAVYKFYAEKRPSNFCNADDPFYIATHTRQGSMNPNDQWFKRQPIGINKLTSTMKRMAKAAGLPEEKKLSNHSARKHLVQTLSECNVPANQIMQITGHRNIQSINNYSHISNEQHKNISNMLSSTSNHHPRSISHSNSMYNTTNSMTSMQHESQQNSHVNLFGSFHTVFGGNIHGGTFNININNNPSNTDNQPVKRRRILPISDDESD